MTVECGFDAHDCCVAEHTQVGNVYCQLNHTLDTMANLCPTPQLISKLDYSNQTMKTKQLKIVLVLR